MSGTKEQHEREQRDREREGRNQPGQLSDDELMAIRKQSGCIAEVIEPVERVRRERTN